MTVVDLDKVDGIGISKNNDKIALMISDHLDWTDEYKHLKILQDKINSYVIFIESKQVYQLYPESKNIKKFIFDFRFKKNITNNCRLLLENIEKQLQPLNIEFKIKEN